MKRILILIFSGIFFCNLSFAKEYLLKYRFKEGETQKYELTLDGRGTARIGESNPFPFELKTKIFLEGEVKEVSADGIITLKLTPSDIQVNLKPQVGFTIPKEFKTITYSITFTPQGRTLKTEGLSEFPTNSDAEVGLRILAESASYAELIFPDRPVKVGDTWEQKVVKDIRSPVVIKYKLEEVKNDTAVISSTVSFPISTLNIIEVGDYNPVRGVVKGITRYYFSLKKSQVVKYESEGKFKFNALKTSLQNEEYQLNFLSADFEGKITIQIK